MDKVNIQVVRELFGRVVYSHKTHEKEAEIQEKYIRDVKILNMLLVSFTSAPLLANIVVNQRFLLIMGATFSFLQLAFSIFQLSFDPKNRFNEHKATANKLWPVREKLVCLMADITNNHIVDLEIINRRDLLIDELDKIYANAPNTSPKAYGMASVALKKNEELTFSNDEINNFLPRALWL